MVLVTWRDQYLVRVQEMGSQHHRITVWIFNNRNIQLLAGEG